MEEYRVERSNVTALERTIVPDISGAQELALMLKSVHFLLETLDYWTGSPSSLARNLIQKFANKALLQEKKEPLRLRKIDLSA